MNMLERGAAHLEARRSQVLAEAMVYNRVRVSDPGDSSLNLPDGVTISAPDANNKIIVSLALQATVGKTPFNQVNESGMTIINEFRDYLVLIDDFANFWPIATIDGSAAEPVAGDYVIQTVAGVDQKYELMSPGNMPVYSSSGSYGSSLRLHTKQSA